MGRFVAVIESWKAMSERIECIVVGAGVVGLAIARALAMAGREVVVLEAQSAIGTQSSSRNSEVIHAGIYYPKGSLKARACIRGKELLYDHCASHKVNYRKIGKLIVATCEAELGLLEGYMTSAEANGVLDLEMLSQSEAQSREPEVLSVGALWSPSTGIVDAAGLMLSFQGDLEAAGGSIALRSPAMSLQTSGNRFAVDVGGPSPMSLMCDVLINSAGHGAPSLASTMGGVLTALVPVPHFAAGHYFTYSGRSPFTHLVYPVAIRGGLGIHGTLDLGGQVRFGPEVTWREGLDYEFNEALKSDFADSIRCYFPGLEEDRLSPGYVGVRTKISGPKDKAADFMIVGPQVHQIPGLVHLFGIESPGLTSCLALAEEVVARLR
jgi:L-2-hydroxyglutarate oxidase LhgO